jgi:hypothetical protein
VYNILSSISIHYFNFDMSIYTIQAATRIRHVVPNVYSQHDYNTIGNCADCGAICTPILRVQASARHTRGPTKMVCCYGCRVKCTNCDSCINYGNLTYCHEYVKLGGFLPPARCFYCQTVNIPTQVWIGQPPMIWRGTSHICDAAHDDTANICEFIQPIQHLYTAMEGIYHGFCDDCHKDGIVSLVPADGNGHVYTNDSEKLVCSTGCKVPCEHCGAILDYGSVYCPEGYKPNVICPNCTQVHNTTQVYSGPSPQEECRRYCTCPFQRQLKVTPVIKLYNSDIMNGLQVTLTCDLPYGDEIRALSHFDLLDVNQYTRLGKTTLEIAIKYVDVAIIMWLLYDRGANPKQRTSSGEYLVDLVYKCKRLGKTCAELMECLLHTFGCSSTLIGPEHPLDANLLGIVLGYSGPEEY